MDQITDQIILKRLADGQEPEALAELVRRYGGLVYFTALRQVRDPHLAEDIAQAVFIVLLRKARTIRPDAVLASWFFTVTRHAINNARRMENRRRIHEGRKAAMTDDQYHPAEVADDGPHPLLSEAIAKLPEADRSAVVLRYFQNRTTREVAESLAISEEATRKRLSRALEKMRSFLEHHGVTDAQAVLSAGLTQSLSIIPAPAALAKSIVNVALISHSTGASASVLTIAKGAARMITFTTQMKAAVVAVGVFIILGAVAVPLLKSAPTSQRTSAPASQPAVNGAAAGSTPDDPNELIAVVSDQIKVHVLGVSPYPGDADSWSSASGNPIKRPDVKIPQSHFYADPAPTNQIVVRIEKPDSVLARCKVAGVAGGMSGFGSSSPGGDINLMAFTPDPDAKTAILDVMIAESDWQTIATDDNIQQGGDFDAKDYGTFKIQPVEEKNVNEPVLRAKGNGNSSRVGTFPNPNHGNGKPLPTVVVSHSPINVPMQIVAVDQAGVIHKSNGGSQSSINGMNTTTDRFDMPLANIKQILIQVRPYTKKVELSDISMVPGQVTKPEVKITDIPQDAK